MRMFPCMCEGVSLALPLKLSLETQAVVCRGEAGGVSVCANVCVRECLLYSNKMRTATGHSVNLERGGLLQHLHLSHSFSHSLLSRSLYHLRLFCHFSFFFFFLFDLIPFSSSIICQHSLLILLFSPSMTVSVFTHLFSSPLFSATQTCFSVTASLFPSLFSSSDMTVHLRSESHNPANQSDVIQFYLTCVPVSLASDRQGYTAHGHFVK